jgi:hypothetical protein
MRFIAAFELHFATNRTIPVQDMSFFRHFSSSILSVLRKRWRSATEVAAPDSVHIASSAMHAMNLSPTTGSLLCKDSTALLFFNPNRFGARALSFDSGPVQRTGNLAITVLRCSLLLI